MLVGIIGMINATF